MPPRDAYDDPHAYARRWERLDSAAVGRAAERDPLLFVADHVATADRREGSLVIHARTDDGRPMMIVIADGPAEPTDDACVAALATAVERIGSSSVVELGVLHHRRGRAHIAALDRRWQRALSAVCHHYGIVPVGVVARTESGAIVQVPCSDD